jgi:hypothetical protein
MRLRANRPTFDNLHKSLDHAHGSKMDAACAAL